MLIKFCITILSLVLTIPILFGLADIKGKKLSGVTKKEDTYDLSLTNILNQKFQRSFEEQFKKFTKISGYFIRTDNQLNILAFKQASSSPSSNVIYGKDNHFFEKPYLRNANRTFKYSEKKINKVAKELQLFQTKLKERGIGFLLVISPNKPSFYPNILPDWYNISGRETRLENRDYLINKLDALGVNFLDGYNFLKEKEVELKQEMFATTGTHWNQLAGCLVSSEILKRASSINQKSYTQMKCDITGTRPSPAHSDTDLIRIANLWFPKWHMRPAPIVKPIGVFDNDSTKPSLLFVGSSFVWELLRQFEGSKTLKNYEFLYYFNRRVSSHAGKNIKIDRAKFDFDSILKNIDFLVIEINQAFVAKAGFTFPQAYLKR
jgi:hypothetical protein